MATAKPPGLTGRLPVIYSTALRITNILSSCDSLSTVPTFAAMALSTSILDTLRPAAPQGPSQNNVPVIVQTAGSGVRGFDTDAVITSDLARKFYDEGYRFCVRYISRRPEAPGDLSRREAKNILNAGLALMVVQHVREPGWSPTGELGQQDGTQAATNATGIGLPPGINLWCDLEGLKNGTAAQNVIDYCNAWWEAVRTGGFVPGLYVGANSILDSEQLYDLPFQHYWKSESKVPDVLNTGYQLIQQYPSKSVNGIEIDVDFTQTDNDGGQVLWGIQRSFRPPDIYLA